MAGIERTRGREAWSEVGELRREAGSRSSQRALSHDGHVGFILS